MSKIMDVLSYDGEGAYKSYINEKWAVAVKNYKPASSMENFSCIEKHFQTDELFIPAVGECILITAEEINGKYEFDAVRLENGKIYNVKQGMWHNAIMNPDTKVMLVEAPNTSLETTEIMNLSEEDIFRVKQLAAKI